MVSMLVRREANALTSNLFVYSTKTGVHRNTENLKNIAISVVSVSGRVGRTASDQSLGNLIYIMSNISSASFRSTFTFANKDGAHHC
jgi:hypothetical protein